MALRGHKTVVIDFDIGLRNLDLIMGCERRVVYDFVNVVQGEATLHQALIKDKNCDNLFILAASQTKDKDALNEEGVEKVIEDLSKDFGKEKREVTLAGEGFFDVTKNNEMPFIISTASINIKVLGTTFNVKAYNEDKQTETSLLHGSIEVTIKNRPNDKIILSPSEKLVVENSITTLGLNDIKKSKENITRTTIPDINTLVSINKLKYNPEDSTAASSSPYIFVMSLISMSVLFILTDHCSLITGNYSLFRLHRASADNVAYFHAAQNFGVGKITQSHCDGSHCQFVVCTDEEHSIRVGG